jgi:hypothetical protein
MLPIAKLGVDPVRRPMAPHRRSVNPTCRHVEAPLDGRIAGGSLGSVFEHHRASREVTRHAATVRERGAGTRSVAA